MNKKGNGQGRSIALTIIIILFMGNLYSQTSAKSIANVEEVNTPDWVKHAVFYQIFPDRFAKSERTQHPKGITFREWDDFSEPRGFMGGDLYGVVEKLDYLKDLGITALYLNPIFMATTYHRYNTFDYYTVDPLLGGNDALRLLIDEAHKRDIKIVLDGVFNHTGRGFWAFNHILDNGERSPYLDWFTINGWPLRPYSYDPGESSTSNYAHWSRFPSLPKFNIHNPGVRQYILDVAKYWLDFGIDGWRLDVATEIEDHSFWQEFRKVVKGANPEAYIVGEKWVEAQPWLQGDQFDAVMNYYMGWAPMKFFGKETLHPEFVEKRGKHDNVSDAETLAERITYLLNLYDKEIVYAQMNFVGSHDTARALWNLGDDKSALRLCTLFMMTTPGAPTIYYGDEIGMSAADDPYCRETFPWQDTSKWDQELLQFYKDAIALRNAHPVLRTGSFETLYAKNDVYAFLRKSDKEDAIVLFNASKSDRTVRINPKNLSRGQFKGVWPQRKNPDILNFSSSAKVTIAGRSGKVLIQQK